MRGPTLRQQVFVGVELALRIEHRKEIGKAGLVELGGELYGLRVAPDGALQPLVAGLLLRIADQGVLGLFESRQYYFLICNGGLLQSRVLYVQLRTQATASEDGQTDRWTGPEEVADTESQVV